MLNLKVSSKLAYYKRHRRFKLKRQIYLFVCCYCFITVKNHRHLLSNEATTGLVRVVLYYMWYSQAVLNGKLLRTGC